MKFKITLSILLMTFCSINISTYSQILYTGKLDKFPISLIYDGSESIYVYENHDTPIILTKNIQNNALTLIENNDGNFVFQNFSHGNKSSLNGIWKNLKTKKEFNVVLTKVFNFNQNNPYKKMELLQSASLENTYFKLLISNQKQNFRSLKGEIVYFPDVVGVRIYEKKTDALLQEFQIDCVSSSTNNLQIADYNNDGFKDFSVREALYTKKESRLYFVFNPKTKLFIESDISYDED
jgi:hypothetical protein